MNESAGDIEERIHDLRQRVTSKEEFLVLVSLLREDFRANSNQWENKTLESYLEAMEAWGSQMEQYYESRGVMVDFERPSWRVFVDLLLAARVYE